MGQKVVQAIIENGRLKNVGHKLPPGKLKVKIFYEAVGENFGEDHVARVVKDTFGIYKGVNARTESKRLRESWERNAHK
jgi:hypothetical protein